MLPKNPPASRETSRMSAPNERITALRSSLIQSGMKITTGCPSAAPSAEKAMPVLPLVASTIVSPGLSAP